MTSCSCLWQILIGMFGRHKQVFSHADSGFLCMQRPKDAARKCLEDTKDDSVQNAKKLISNNYRTRSIKSVRRKRQW